MLRKLAAVVAALPERIYPLVADLRAWRAWSPWEALDPAMTRTFGGAPSGVGATYGWAGNGDVGKGSMTITAAEPSSRVAIDLAFLEPFEAHNVTEFTLAPTPTGTRVTWAMRGPQPFLGKVMRVFLSPDAIVGPDFEKGLAALKREAERGSWVGAVSPDPNGKSSRDRGLIQTDRIGLAPQSARRHAP